MPRISKEPEVRKQEIMDTAMRLFAQKGYDATSMADIAREMGVVPGLCYRYFPSKHALFQAAVAQYAQESCQPFLALLRQDLPLPQKMEAMMAQMVSTEQHSRYSHFYHQPQNQTFHVQLALAMCAIMAPPLTGEVARLQNQGTLRREEDPAALADFILYGLVSLWAAPPQGAPPLEERLPHLARYVKTLLQLD